MNAFALTAKGKGQRARGKTGQTEPLIFWPRALLGGLMVAWCLTVFSGCGTTPVSYVHPTADLTYITTVAIVPFQNLTQERGAEGKMANMVAAEVLRRGVFDVVEFGEVIKVLREEGFRPEEGLINKNMAERAGKRLNAQAFITGSVQEYGLSRGGGSTYPEVSLSLSLIDAKSHKILWEATHSLKGGTLLDRLFGIGKKSPSDLSQELVADMLDTLFGG
jgi:polysaccharide biosynthesis protein PelC